MISPWMAASLASRSIVFLPGSAACQQLLTGGAWMFRLDLRSQGLGFVPSSLQVGVHFVAVAEVVGDDGVDIGQQQGVVGADHVFWGHAVLVLLDEKVDGYPTLADTDDAPFVGSQRRTISAQRKWLG